MKGKSINTTPRDRAIIDIALKEVSREHCREFAPIVKGPLFAVAGLAYLAGVAAVYFVFGKLGFFLGWGRRK